MEAELATRPVRSTHAGAARRIFAIANQKGGVGKTTTAINLGAALAAMDRRVLIIDLDPQGNASTGLGVEPKDRRRSSYDLLMGDASLAMATIATPHAPTLFLVPSTKELSGADIDLMSAPDGRHRLRSVLRDAVGDGPTGFDYVLIDCPPSLNILTVNALTAADAVVVPLQCEFFALEGLGQLINTIRRIRKNLNPDLGVQGVILTMYDARHKSCQEVADEARGLLGDLVFQTIVPRNVKIAEAPSHGQPALLYDHQSPGSMAYIRLAGEVLEREADPALA